MRKIAIAFYKPYDVLCQFTGPGDVSTIADHISVPEVYPCGRLDKDSEGLLILSNDGSLQARISHPRFHLPKTYLVMVEGTPDRYDLDRLNQGLRLSDGPTAPAVAKIIEPPPQSLLPGRDLGPEFKRPTSWIELTIREGRNRQVRRMTAAVGHPTLRLIRARIGPVTLGELRPGEFRELGTEEIRQIYHAIRA